MYTNNTSIGTLGDNNGYLTCSMSVAHDNMPNCKLVPYSSFEEAIIALKQDMISLVLVPAAYPQINYFIMDDDITVKESFVKEIPPLVLVTTNKNRYIHKSDINNLYLHKATYSILEQMNCTSNCNIYYVNSNIDACKMLIEDNSSYCAAITNLICANYFDLHIVELLRNKVRMPWVVFEKK